MTRDTRAALERLRERLRVALQLAAEASPDDLGDEVERVSSEHRDLFGVVKLSEIPALEGPRLILVASRVGSIWSWSVFDPSTLGYAVGSGAASQEEVLDQVLEVTGLSPIGPWSDVPVRPPATPVAFARGEGSWTYGAAVIALWRVRP